MWKLFVFILVQISHNSVSTSDICGPFGNSTNVTSWRRISSWAQDSHIHQNPLDFEEALLTVSGVIFVLLFCDNSEVFIFKIVHWIGTGGDYWLDQSHCVEKFIQKVAYF